MDGTCSERVMSRTNVPLFRELMQLHVVPQGSYGPIPRHVSSYYYICVLILRYMCARSPEYASPHAPTLALVSVFFFLHFFLRCSFPTTALLRCVRWHSLTLLCCFTALLFTALLLVR